MEYCYKHWSVAILGSSTASFNPHGGSGAKEKKDRDAPLEEQMDMRILF
jgi:hypothetical protein